MFKNQPVNHELNDLDSIKINQEIVEPDGQLYYQPSNKRNQKIILLVAGVIGMVIIFLAGFKINNLLKIPFSQPEPGSENLTAEKASLSLADQAPAVLKNQDTDQDGLNDYEELKIYLTSPYLADTDSDGLSDYQEIASNQDPNCPQGQECFSRAGGGSQNVSVEDLRQALVDTGLFTVEEVGQFDEQMILEAYQASQESLSQGEFSLDPIEITDSDQITPDQIRALLREQGVDESMLQQVDDATLLQMYQDALAEVAQ